MRCFKDMAREAVAAGPGAKAGTSLSIIQLSAHFMLVISGLRIFTAVGWQDVYFPFVCTFILQWGK